MLKRLSETACRNMLCICTAVLAMQISFNAHSAYYYEPEIYPQNVTEINTLGMSSGERLDAFFDLSGLPKDPAAEELKQSVSPETAGILNVGGDITEIIVQGSDNDFYLHHNAYGGEDINGAAFLDSRCRYFPQDDQLIIHGHNMKGGAIFGRLNNYRDINYLRQHPLITFETLQGTQIYVPYAIADVNVDREADNYFPEIQFRFDPDSFAAYTGTLIEKSYYSIPIDVKFGDKLLMLSTCSYVYSDSRFVICARKLRPNETPEEMAALVEQAADSGAGLDDTRYLYNGGGDYESLSDEEIADLFDPDAYSID